MNRLVIKDISIVNKNKEKFTGLKLENKNLKFILYSYENDKPNENNTFKEFSFEKEFNITSKKKMSSLNLSIVFEDDLHKLKLNDKNVFYIENLTPTLNDEHFKIILNNGKLYENKKEIDLNLDQEDDLVSQILSSPFENPVVEESKTVETASIEESTIVTDSVVEESKTVEEPVIEESTTFETPSIEESTIVTDSVVEESKTVEEPVIEESTTFETPSIEESTIVTDSVVEESKTVEEPVIEESTTFETPSIEKSTIVTDSVVEKSKTVEEPVVKESKTVEEPVVKESKTVEEPVVKESKTVEKPVVEKSKTVEEPVVKESKTVEEPVVKESINVNDSVVEESKSSKKSNDILNEIKEIISNTKSNQNNNENISYNIKKIDNELKKPGVNINNIISDLTETYNNDNYIKNVNTTADTINYMNIDFFKKKYVVKIHKIISSNLNMYNLNKAKVLKENIINDYKLTLLLENKNSSYLINYFNYNYLINKVNDKLLITNLKNKKTLVLRNNSFFKLLNYNFYLINNCSLIIPITNKKVYNNNNGMAMNYFEPII